MKKINKVYLNILIVVQGMLFVGCNSEGNSLETNTSDEGNLNTTVPVILTEFKEAYLLEVNKARSVQQNCGSEGIFEKAIALTWSDKLYQAAYEHSYDMSTSNTISHSGSGKASDKTGVALGKASTFKERIESYAYKYSTIGENIASGTNTDTAKKVVLQLMASDGHCANIMNPKFRELGMAMSKNSNSKYTHYWTQNFGTPR